MSRERQTGRRPEPRSNLTRSLHLDSEQRARFLILGGVALVLLVAGAFLGFGYYWSEIRPEGRTVLQVDDTKVSYAAMKRRMEYEFFQSVRYQNAPQLLASGAFDALVEELIQVNRAETALGVTVTQEEFDTRLRSRLGVASNAAPEVFNDALKLQLDTTDLKESEFRRLLRAEVLNEKIRDKFRAELPASMLQARVETLSVPTEEEARAAIDRINGGEAFGDVARAVSTEADAATTGGLKDFAPDGTLNQTYNGFAFSAEPGTLSEPLAAGSSVFYVVHLLERSEQPLAEDDKPTLASNKVDEWLTTTRTQMEGDGSIVNKFDEEDQTEAAIEVVSDAQPRLLAQQQAAQAAQQQAEQQRQTQVAQATLSPAPAVTGTPAAEGTPAADSTAPASTPAGDSGLTPPAQPPGPSDGQ